MKDLEANSKLVQDWPDHSADGRLFAKILTLPKILTVQPGNNLAEIAEPVPGWSQFFLARFIDNPLPRNVSAIPRLDQQP